MRWILGTLSLSVLTLACGSDPSTPESLPQPSPAGERPPAPPAPEPPVAGASGSWFLASNTRDAGGSRAEASPLIAYRHDGASWQRVVLAEDAAGSGIVPSFSPSGKLVVYGVVSGEQSAVLSRTVTAQGFGDPVEIARFARDTNHRTAWYPNDRLLVTPGDGGWISAVLDLQPDGEAIYTAIPELDSISPDGAFAVERDAALVELLPAGGRGATRLLPIGADEQVHFDSFSHDGRFLALSVRAGGSSSWSRVIDLRDPSLHATDYLRAEVTSTSGMKETRLAWAPTGSTMLVSLASYEHPAESSVWLADAKTGAYTELDIAGRGSDEYIHEGLWFGTSSERFMLLGSERIQFLQLAPGATTTDLGIDLSGGASFSSGAVSRDNRYFFANLHTKGAGLFDLSATPSTFQVLDANPCGEDAGSLVRWSADGRDATLQCDSYRGQDERLEHAGSAVGLLTWDGDRPQTRWSDFVAGVQPSGSSLFEPGSTRWVAPSPAGLTLHATHALDAGELAPSSVGLVVLGWQPRASER